MSVENNTIILNPLSLTEESEKKLLSLYKPVKTKSTNFVNNEGKPVSYETTQIRSVSKKSFSIELYEDEERTKKTKLKIPAGTYILLEDYHNVLFSAGRGFNTNNGKVDLLIKFNSKDEGQQKVLEFQKRKNKALLEMIAKNMELIGLDTDPDVKIEDSVKMLEMSKKITPLCNQPKDKDSKKVIKESSYGTFLKYVKPSKYNNMPPTSVVYAEEIFNDVKPEDLTQINPKDLEMSLSCLICWCTTELYSSVTTKKFSSFLSEVKVVDTFNEKAVAVAASYNSCKGFLSKNSSIIKTGLAEEIARANEEKLAQKDEEKESSEGEGTAPPKLKDEGSEDEDIFSLTKKK